MAIFTGKTVAEAIQNGLRTLKLSRHEVEINLIESPKKGFLGLHRREAQVEVKAILPQHTGGALLHPDLAEEVNVQQHQKEATEGFGGVEEAPTEDESEEATDDQQINPAEIHRREVANQQKLNQVAEMAGYYLGDILDGMQLPVETTVTVDRRTVTIELATDQPAKVIGRHGMTINALQSMGQTFMNLHGVAKVTVVLDTNDYRKKRETVLIGVAKKAATEVIASGTAVYLDPMPANERKQVHQILAENKFVRTYSHGRDPRRSVVVAPAGELS